jgi:RNA polymerase sigma factor (sigma-70 family)
MNVVIQHLLADLRPDGESMTDGELLARFLRSRDGDALAALVGRHAPMVWGVCRRLLNHHEAEDAFQATFLVLVRKAADVREQTVANWLYGVARQTAVRLRATAAKRRRRETQMMNMPEPTMPDIRDADLQRVVDEELSRLPDHYRGVVVLCDLEGMTRREAARQLGIPEGSVASRLARARVLLSKRLAQRGIVSSGGSAAAVLSVNSASASAPPALVASTIRAASLLAAGQAAGAISANVAALTEGVVQTMFATKLKSALAVVLVVVTLTGAVGMIYQTRAAEPPKDASKKAEEKPAPALPTPQAAKTDRERMVGNWFITNEDSLRQGEMWVITEDSILMHAKDLGLNTHHYAHRLDASKNPKQIDITITKGNGSPVGVIKGIYVLDGDELRLCLGEMDKDRPAAFPEKRKPGEVLILRRETFGVTPPKAQSKPPAKTDRERMVGNWFIMNEDSGRQGEMWVISEDWILMHAKDGGATAQHYWHRLDAGKNPKQIDITQTAVNGPVIGSMKGIYTLDGDELRLCLAAIGQDRPTAFPEKPAVGQVLILQRAASGATPPKAKEIPPAKTDQELMVGAWFIVNEDSGRKGEEWWIGTGAIVMQPNLWGFRIVKHLYRLDTTKNPKQIDITVKKMNDEYVGVMKGIYVLDGDELRLCLGQTGKDRPAAFPEKPKRGEVLILQRAMPDGGKPKAKDAQPKQNVLTPDEAIQQRDQERMTVQFKVASAQFTSHFKGSDLLANSEIELTDGKKFSILLRRPVRDQIVRLGIEPATHFGGKVVRVTGRVQPVLPPDTGKGPFWIVVDDLNQFEVVR